MIDGGRGDLVDYMSDYWKDFRGDDANLWEHEWNKHGTCVSTLEPKCYDEYIPQQDVIDYFDKAVEIYKQRNTYQVRGLSYLLTSRRRSFWSEVLILI